MIRAVGHSTRALWLRDSVAIVSAALICPQTIFAFRAQIFHHALNELLGFPQLFRDDLNIHSGFGGVAMAVAIDSVLAHNHHRIRYAVQRHCKAPAVRSQHLLVMLDLFLMILKCGHGTSPACCNRGAGSVWSSPQDCSLYIQTTRISRSVQSLEGIHLLWMPPALKPVARLEPCLLHKLYSLGNQTDNPECLTSRSTNGSRFWGQTAPVSAYNLSGQDF